MIIRVRFFAVLRDLCGCEEMHLDLPEDATVEDALAQLVPRYRGMEAWKQRLAVAVNQDYAAATTVLHAGDELALIPPVSGG